METIVELSNNTHAWVLRSEHQTDIPLKGQIYIGRDPECDICIDDHRISRTHAKISVKPFGMLLEDLGSANGTSVNGKKINQTIVLQSGDSVTFHTMEFRVINTMPISSKSLVLKSGTHDDLLLKGIITIGREPECGICIVDDLISRHHARITTTPSGPVIEDLGSVNGTFINAKKITKPHLMKYGDFVSFHEHKFQVDRTFDPDATSICSTGVDINATRCGNAIVSNRNSTAHSDDQFIEIESPSTPSPIPRFSRRSSTSEKLSAIELQARKSNKVSLKRLQLLKPSMWVTFKNRHGKFKAYRLDSILDLKDEEYRFVRSMGFGVIKKSRERVAIELNKGDMKILQKRPFLGRIASLITNN